MRSVISPISSRKIVPSSASLELARLVAIGAGEAALDVAEQLRLEQRFGQAGAVDGDERPRRRAGCCVWMARGDELLADAALAGDQHLGVGARDALDLLAQLQHRVAAANEVGLFGASHICARCRGRLGPAAASGISNFAARRLGRRPGDREVEALR